jgi:hypothetical protein
MFSVRVYCWLPNLRRAKQECRLRLQEQAPKVGALGEACTPNDAVKLIALLFRYFEYIKQNLSLFIL